MNYHITVESGISDFFFTCKRNNIFCLPHVHSHIEFIYVLNGRLVLETDEEACVLEKNHMAVIMPYQIHNYQSNEYSETFIIACPPEYFAEYRQIFNGKVFSPSQIAFSEAIYHIINGIAQSTAQDYFKNKSLIYYSIAEFLNQSSLVQRKSLEYDVYRKAIIYISEHYTENITLESVAFHAGVTAPHLSRVMNIRGKSSFSDIVNSLRVYNAKRMLEQTTLPISDIAFEAGYGSIRNFNRNFQEYFGCTPSEIRKKGTL